MIGNGALLYFAVAFLLAGIFLLWPNNKETKSFGIKILITALLLEVFVCNFHSFHLFFRKYDKNDLLLSEANISGGILTDDGRIKKTSRVTISFDNIDQRIGTVKINCSMLDPPEDDYEETKSTNNIKVSIDASDETYSSQYRYGIANGEILRGNPRSETVVLNMSGNVKNMRIILSAEANCYFDVNSITVNSPVPFYFSTLRLIILVVVCLLIYALMRFPSMQKTVSDAPVLYSSFSACVTTFFLFAAFMITVMYNLDLTGYPFTDFDLNSGNQITQELVDAFKNGQTSLLEVPSKELLEMDNPYDWGARLEQGLYYKWDHLLFNGKYYSYYGIAPVLLLFLPYNLLTGYYFPTPEAVMLFGMVGISFLTLLFFELTRKFFPKLPLNIALTSLVIIHASSSIYYCFASPLFYEIAQSSGFAFTCAGFYFLIRSNVIGKGKIKKISLCLSSFCLSCAVLCRPTLAVYCVTALIFIAFGFFKNTKESKLRNIPTVRSSILYLLSALSCFVIIGGIQMLYNYARFGSVFDFGIQYSLTINDFTKAEYHTDFTFIGFWNYLFAFPIIKTEFPFIFSNFSDLDTNGYYFIANRNAVGLIFKALPVLGYIFAPQAYKKLDKKHRFAALSIILSVCVICPLVIIFSIWESGYGVRYAADFAWQTVIGALCIIFFLYDKNDLSKNGFAKKTVVAFFISSALISLAINGSLMYDYINKAGILRPLFLNFERLFMFWL